ncbi:MAG: hypothetical protein ACFFCM_12680 [Promethearchaeota archaeon]
MELEKLSNWPADKNVKRLIYFCIVLYFVLFPIFMYYGSKSNYPVNFIASQLSFSGDAIKSHFKTMSAEELNYYRITTLLDFIYAIFYGTLLFSLSLYLARKFNEETSWNKSGYLVSIFGIVAAICDMIENTFILLMLTDPQGFPDAWAITHSCFALVKFILMGIGYIWILLADIDLFWNKIQKFGSFIGVFACVYLHMWLPLFVLITWP